MKKLTTRKAMSLLVVALLCGLGFSAGAAYAQDKKPNIVVIWGDDTGMTSVSAYGHGIVGYKTPNIDRIAKEGGKK